MSYAQNVTGEWSPLLVGQPVYFNDAVYSYETVDLMGDESRDEIAVRFYEERPTPAGKVAVGPPQFEVVNGVLEMFFAYEDAPAPVATAADVDAERDRRMLLPFTFAGKVYDADDKAQDRIEKARLSATAAVMAGAQSGDIEWPGVGMPFAWIAADNSQTPMDARTMVQFGSALAAREGMLIMQARAIKNRLLAGEVIENVTVDTLWSLPA